MYCLASSASLFLLSTPSTIKVSFCAKSCSSSCFIITSTFQLKISEGLIGFLYYEYNKGRVYPSDFLNFYVSIIAYIELVLIIFLLLTELHFLQKTSESINLIRKGRFGKVKATTIRWNKKRRTTSGYLPKNLS